MKAKHKVPRRAPAARTKPRASPKPVGASAAALRSRLGLTRPVFARLVGASERTVASWEKDDAAAGSERALREIRSVVEACERVMKPDFVGRWIVAPNDSLAGFKPIELIERGETARVLRALFFVEAGTPL